MLVYKGVHLVYAAVDDDVEAAVDTGMLGDLFGCEGFGHRGEVDGGGRVSGIEGRMRVVGVCLKVRGLRWVLGGRALVVRSG